MAEIQLRDAPKFIRGLKDRMTVAAQRGLLLAGQRGVRTIQIEIMGGFERPPVNRGVYRAGWYSEATAPMEVIIANDEVHASFIEDGVRAENVKIGTAMISALVEWVTMKGIASDEKEAISAAWAIANAAKESGIFNTAMGSGYGVLRIFEQQYADRIVREEVTREMNAEVSRING